MLTYTSEPLKALDVDRPPRREVRKTLFALQLWLPARYRRQGHVRHRNTTHFAEVSEACPSLRRSADRSMVIGWLNTQSLRNKTEAVHSTITDNCLDVLTLTETWHNGSGLRLSTPAGYAVIGEARTSGRGGGVAIIFRQQFKSAVLPVPACTALQAFGLQPSTAQ